MALNTGYFLACVVAFFSGRISVLDRLGVNNAKTGGLGPTIAYTDLAN